MNIIIEDEPEFIMMFNSLTRRQKLQLLTDSVRAMKKTLPYEKYISGYLKRQKALCSFVIFSLLWARRAAQQTEVEKESAGKYS